MANIAKNKKISLIVVLSKKNRAIGIKNKLLWKINGDLPRFKKLTTGHPIIMGRKTYESIGRPLPDRTNIIITRNPSLKIDNCLIANSIEEAVRIAECAEGSDEIFIIGGGEIFKESITLADRLYLTVVNDEPVADTFFPEYSNFRKEIFHEDCHEHNPSFSYITLEK